MNINKLLILISINGILIITGCEKKEDDTKSTERTNYISFKQDGVPIEVDSIYITSQIITMWSDKFKAVNVTFYDKSRNRYQFSLADSSLDLSYLTPKKYQENRNSFSHFNNAGYFSGLSQLSSFTCTKSDKNTKLFSGNFEIVFVNEPNRTDTILVTEGVVENLKLP
jgi:hypothetical protein